ncbi:MAG: protein-L-isoaspartate(D-aspartate) O-methyltransferase [Acidobacteria bacterium]|nr:protein-L-isoaspartate(D-aspartate) O-methyltransferase [Acidobacteriota bacterium]
MKRKTWCGVLLAGWMTGWGQRSISPVEYPVRRQGMVKEQLVARGIKDPHVLAAMARVPRELFVPPDQVPFAYEDRALPIGRGQTISPPYMVALMTELLAPGKRDRVLEVGTGSGYQAAVLGRLAGKVYSLEIVPELARTAALVLRTNGFRNVQVREGDGCRGWAAYAPYDRILLTAAPPEIPAELLAQLRPGGRLVAPVGEETQRLVVVDKSLDGRTQTRSLVPVRFVPMVRGSGQRKE